MGTSTSQPHRIRHGSDFYNSRDNENRNYGLEVHHKQQDTRYLKLVWDEKGVALECKLEVLVSGRKRSF